VSLSMLTLHGAAWLGLKARVVASVGYAVADLWLAFGIDSYALTSEVVANGPSNPLYNAVEHSGCWVSAYVHDRFQCVGLRWPGGFARCR